jgi:hypothetical protein
MAIGTRSTAIAAFASRADAERAIRGLLAAEFEPERLGLVLPDTLPPSGAMVSAGPVTVCVGAMFRSLLTEEIPDAEARYYAEDLQEGRPLVLVRSGYRYQEAVDILNRNGGKYIAAF